MIQLEEQQQTMIMEICRLAKGGGLVSGGGHRHVALFFGDGTITAVSGRSQGRGVECLVSVQFSHDGATPDMEGMAVDADALKDSLTAAEGLKTRMRVGKTTLTLSLLSQDSKGVVRYEANLRGIDLGDLQIDLPRARTKLPHALTMNSDDVRHIARAAASLAIPASGVVKSLDIEMSDCGDGSTAVTCGSAAAAAMLLGGRNPSGCVVALPQEIAASLPPFEGEVEIGTSGTLFTMTDGTYSVMASTGNAGFLEPVLTLEKGLLAAASGVSVKALRNALAAATAHCRDGAPLVVLSVRGDNLSVSSAADTDGYSTSADVLVNPGTGRMAPAHFNASILRSAAEVAAGADEFVTILVGEGRSHLMLSGQGGEVALMPHVFSK